MPIRFHVFQTSDYKKMEMYYAKMAGEGLVLSQHRGFYSTFEKSEPQELKYSVVEFNDRLFNDSDDYGSEKSFIAQAQRKGWRLIDQTRTMYIFEAPKESEILPVYETELLRYKAIKKSVISNATSFGFLVLVYTFMIASTLSTKNSMGAMSSYQMTTMFLMLSLIFLLLASISKDLFWVYYNRSILKEDTALKPVSNGFSIAQSIIFSTAIVVMLLTIVVQQSLNVHRWPEEFDVVYLVGGLFLAFISAMISCFHTIYGKVTPLKSLGYTLLYTALMAGFLFVIKVSGIVLSNIAL